MNYYGNTSNVNDFYLNQVFYNAFKHGLEFPVYQMCYNNNTKSIITDKKFILMLTGNENHKNLDHFYEDPRIVSIIKNYPAIKNTATADDTQQYKMEITNGIPFIPVEQEDPRTLNIPLGYCNDFVPYNFSTKRKAGGFVGQWTKNRINAITAIKSYFRERNLELQYDWALYSGFGPNVRKGYQTPGINSSLDIDEYAFHLADMEISFCFGGQSPETFRLVESAASGCIIVSDVLPKIWYYESLPALFVPHWKDFVLEQLFRKLKSKESDALQAMTSKWFVECISPPAVGKKISEHVRSIL
jgi:hypothetical protein